MKSILGIKKGLTDKLSNRDISRKIFLSYPTQVFIDNEEMEFEIKDAIALEFSLKFANIEICGSAKTGLSFFNDYAFSPGESDLDVSIISSRLYNVYLEIAHYETNGFSDLSKFPFHKNERTDRQFLSNLAKGFFNPLLMPKCDDRTYFLDFFNSLSNKYYKIFKSINAAIYSSEYFFEVKQEECIEKYIKEPKKYDKISGTI